MLHFIQRVCLCPSSDLLLLCSQPPYRSEWDRTKLMSSWISYSPTQPTESLSWHCMASQQANPWAIKESHVCGRQEYVLFSVDTWPSAGWQTQTSLSFSATAACRWAQGSWRHPQHHESWLGCCSRACGEILNHLQTGHWRGQRSEFLLISAPSIRVLANPILEDCLSHQGWWMMNFYAYFWLITPHIGESPIMETAAAWADTGEWFGVQWNTANMVCWG